MPNWEDISSGRRKGRAQEKKRVKKAGYWYLLLFDFLDIYHYYNQYAVSLSSIYIRRKRSIQIFIFLQKKNIFLKKIKTEILLVASLILVVNEKLKENLNF